MLKPICNISLLQTPTGVLSLRHEMRETDQGVTLTPGVAVNLSDVKVLVDTLYGQDVDGSFIDRDVFYMGSHVVGWVVPAKNWLLNFNVRGVKFSLNAPLPNIAIVCNGENFLACAVKERFVTGDTDCFHAPLMNFYANGGMCFGSVQKPTSSPKENRQVWEDVIFKSYFSHTSHSKVIKQKDTSNEGYITLFKSLSDKTAFPVGKLSPMGKKVSQLVQELTS
jgi:PRTRC genetic system protein B